MAVAAESEFDFTWAFGSSGVFYGDPDFNTQFDTIKARGNKNIVLSGEAGIRVMFTEYIGITVNAIVNMDMLMFEDFNLFLDYGIASGARVYTGLGGLNLGIEYVTGRRTDFVSAAPTTSSSWGNGFRFLLEYEFKNLIKSFSPSLGIAWRRMPRGNNAADNIVTFCIRAPF